MSRQRGELRALLDLFFRILLITAVLVGFFFLIDFIDNTHGDPIYSIEDQQAYKEYRPQAPWETAAPGPEPVAPQQHIIGYERFTWAFTCSIYTGMLGLYVVAVFFVVQLAKRHERNVVAWTTAAILFTPVLTVIAYLLTWPKDKPLKG